MGQRNSPKGIPVNLGKALTAFIAYTLRNYFAGTFNSAAVQTADVIGKDVLVSLLDDGNVRTFRITVTEVVR